MARKHRRREPDEGMVEEFESLAERVAGWVGANVPLVVGIVVGIRIPTSSQRLRGRPRAALVQNVETGQSMRAVAGHA